MNRRFRLLFAIVFLLLSERAHAGPSLLGSRESLKKQNLVADVEGLVRIIDKETLESMKGRVLVELPKTIRVDPRLDPEWRWCLPRTADFLEDLGLAFINEFGHFLQVNSAVRTVFRQIELTKINLNAAPVDEEDKDRMSSHLTGATVDIAKIGLNKTELEWLRKKLLGLEGEDSVEATEEQLQLVFHVMVFSTYSGQTQKAN